MGPRSCLGRRRGRSLQQKRAGGIRSAYTTRQAIPHQPKRTGLPSIDETVVIRQSEVHDGAHLDLALLEQDTALVQLKRLTSPPGSPNAR